MQNESQSRDHRKLEELIKELVSRIIDIWICGEGDLIIEVRDDDDNRVAKIKGGHTKRIK